MEFPFKHLLLTPEKVPIGHFREENLTAKYSSFSFIYFIHIDQKQMSPKMQVISEFMLIPKMQEYSMPAELPKMQKYSLLTKLPRMQEYSMPAEL